MNHKLRTILILFLGLPFFSMGQALFNSLKIPSNTQATALGGVLAAHPDENVNLFLNNPALLNEVSQNVSFQHTFYFADTGVEQLTYAHDFKKAGLLGFSLQYFNYGEFEGFDETGIPSGDFRANDFVLTTGYAHEQGSFRFGGNLKFAFSDFVDYYASALLMDVGGVFSHPEKDLTIGLVIKNFGVILSDYTASSTSYLPFDVQAGVAFKPDYMPIRFHLTFYELTNFDIPYHSNEQVGMFDKAFSHAALGAEVLVSKNFRLLAGYNHLKRKELRLENKSAGAGISYGLEIVVKNFDFAYSRSHYVAGQAINQMGINVDLKGFNKSH